MCGRAESGTMMPVLSAGILLFRRPDDGVEVLLGHMGGPYWARKDDRAWTIPKGEVDAGDSELATARREFIEELGQEVPAGELVDLGHFVQSSRKELRIWALEGDLDAARCVSNTFEIEWPPKSGTVATFPELDRIRWFTAADAMSKVVAGQRTVIEALIAHIG